jgi:isopentenyl diphosphate isomerase/L-lactate dehydrogenase-like FMN-dependent dehydrogenase
MRGGRGRSWRPAILDILAAALHITMKLTDTRRIEDLNRSSLRGVSGRLRRTPAM